MTRARRASRPRFRLLPTVLLTLAILGVPTAVYAWGRNSSSFDVKTVTVAGAHLVRDRRALKLLRHDYVGHNLFTVTGKDVRATLQPLSFVAGAKVDRDFPATLAVTIIEYRPAAYALAGGRWYVVDESGYVVCTAAEAAAQLSGGKQPAADASAAASASPDPSASASSAAVTGGDGLPTASATPGATAAAGDATTGGGSGTDSSQAGSLVAGPGQAPLPLPRIAVSGQVRKGDVVTDKAAAEMLGVITALPSSLRGRLAFVEDDGGQLTLHFDDGLVTIWGDSSRTLAKTLALRTVLAKYAAVGKTCTKLDVSVPDRTLAKPVLQ
jgi:cell division septal protein FtsQ